MKLLDYCWHFNISKNKHLEIQFFPSDVNFEFEFVIHTKGDHAGIRFEITLFEQIFIIHFYDKRHWDWTRDKWEE